MIYCVSWCRYELRSAGVNGGCDVDVWLKDARLELGSNEAVKESVAGGLGLGVVSRHALHGLKKENGVSVIDMEGFPVSSAWHIVHPASKRLSPLALAFKKHMIHEVGRRKWPQA